MIKRFGILQFLLIGLLATAASFGASVPVAKGEPSAKTNILEGLVKVGPNGKRYLRLEDVVLRCCEKAGIRLPTDSLFQSFFAKFMRGFLLFGRLIKVWAGIIVIADSCDEAYLKNIFKFSMQVLFGPTIGDSLFYQVEDYVFLVPKAIVAYLLYKVIKYIASVILLKRSLNKAVDELISLDRSISLVYSNSAFYNYSAIKDQLFKKFVEDRSVKNCRKLLLCILNPRLKKTMGISLKV